MFSMGFAERYWWSLLGIGAVSFWRWLFRKPKRYRERVACGAGEFVRVDGLSEVCRWPPQASNGKPSAYSALCILQEGNLGGGLG